MSELNKSRIRFFLWCLVAGIYLALAVDTIAKALGELGSINTNHFEPEKAERVVTESIKTPVAEATEKTEETAN